MQASDDFLDLVFMAPSKRPFVDEDEIGSSSSSGSIEMLNENAPPATRSIQLPAPAPLIMLREHSACVGTVLWDAAVGLSCWLLQNSALLHGK